METDAGVAGAAGLAAGGGLEVALLIHVVLTLLALWPAVRLLRRAGLPAGHAGWLALPVLGWAVFATYLAFATWPNLPPRPEKLHPREALRRQREASAAEARAAEEGR